LTKYLKPGDVFVIEQSTIDANSLLPAIHRIKSVGDYSAPYTPLVICSSTTDVAGGSDSASAYHPVKEVDGDTADGDYDNTIIKFGIVKITGYQPGTAISPLNISAWVSLGLNVLKFNNGYNVNFPQTLDVKTRDIDFGVPSALKAFYNIIITSKSLEPVNVEIAYNGSSQYESLGVLAESSSWVATTFYFDEQNRIPKKAHSIQIRFTNPNNKVRGFELNDVTLIYRSV
jgi:hypothetical protein